MKLLNHIFGRRRKKATPSRRGYAAAKFDRLTSDWRPGSLSSDGELRMALKTLRNRSRDLAINNDYVRKYLNMVITNVVGPKGITLQARCANPQSAAATLASKEIEDAWKEWGQKGVCTRSGMYSWHELQCLVIQSAVRDGEILVRKYSGPSAGNEFKFAVEPFEADYLDETYNLYPVNGRTISMGVEIDDHRRPLAYHLLKGHPGNLFYGYGRERIRVPAGEVVHLYRSDRSEQSRGVPWAHTAMGTLKMLGAYEEAELVAARAAASKMGFLQTPTGEDYEGSDRDENTKEPISEFEPGIIEQLPSGMEFQSFNPDYPSGNYAPFKKALIQKVASGLNVAYSSLASDLEKVNYSSIRAGVLEERNNWRVVQNWMIESFYQPVFDEWLFQSMLAGKVSYSSWTQFQSAYWQPRGWDWVDPLKDEKANVEAINNGLRTRREIIAERGEDIDEVFRQLAREKVLAESLGLTLGTKKSEGTKEEQGGGKVAYLPATQRREE